MCKIFQNKEEITLTQLYEKILESKEVYESDQYQCNILLVEGNATTPLVLHNIEKDVDSAVAAAKVRLEGRIGLTSPVKIKFEYLLKKDRGLMSKYKKKTLWEVYVNVDEIVRKDKIILGR